MHPTATATSPTPNPHSELLEKLISGTLGPLAQLQHAVNLTLDQASSWIGSPKTRQQIDDLTTLLNAQTQLMLCQHRLFAAAKLAEVAATATAPETIRRACVDLLKYNALEPLAGPAHAEGGGAAAAGGRGTGHRNGWASRPDPSLMQPPDPITEQTILAALGRLGAEDHSSYEGADELARSEPEAAANTPSAAPAPAEDRPSQTSSLFTQKGTDGDSSQRPSHIGAVTARASQTFDSGIPRSHAFREAAESPCNVNPAPVSARGAAPRRHGESPPPAHEAHATQPAAAGCTSFARDCLEAEYAPQS